MNHSATKKINQKIRAKINHLKLRFAFKFGQRLASVIPVQNISSRRRKILVVGGTSDIATQYILMEEQNGTEITATSRSTRGVKSINLDFDNMNSVNSFINTVNFNEYTDVIFFTGYQDLDPDKYIRSPGEICSLKSTEVLDKSFVRHLRINALMPFILTSSIANKIREKDRRSETRMNFIYITSEMGTSSRSIEPGAYFYRGGKAALHAMLASLYHEINKDLKRIFMWPRFTITLIRPGSVNTRMNPNGEMKPLTSAICIGRIINKSRDKGGFYFYDYNGKKIRM